MHSVFSLSTLSMHHCSQKQRFRIANCIQANEKLVTPRFTPFSESFIMFLSASLKKISNSQREGKKSN